MSYCFLLCIVWVLPVLAGDRLQSASGRTQAQVDRVRTEIPYREGTVVLVSDFQERLTRTRYRARGHVEITYEDVIISGEEVEYDELTREGFTKGATRFSQGGQWLSCSRAEFNFSNHTATFHEASGFTDKEFLIRGQTIVKTGRDTYRILDGFITACQDKIPKWSFAVSSGRIRVDRTARLRNTVFRLKGIPVFYMPYLIVPMERKDRSSGILPFHTGTSTSKGREMTLGYFQTLGRSVDATIYGSYFTKRGLALGGILRARPNPQTRLYLLTYAIDDREDQGGAHLIVDGETLLKNGFRAVANVNITTNFRFRQAFSDSFRSATIPQERSIAFLTQNRGSYSTNLSFRREEVRFPERSLIVRSTPSLELVNLGQSLGKSPFILDFRIAAEGLSRSDSVIETPSLVQRLDLFPRLTLRIPALGGFSLSPRIGLRQTYYGARIEEDPDPKIVARSLHRRYTEFELDVRTPTLEKTFQTDWLGSFKHVLEPVVTYRRITGIDRLHETLRFDEHDAVANTNEVEYGIVNRIFRKREVRPGVLQQREFLTLSLAQKYYFDPDFGGALRPGESNTFYPLYTLTGFSSSGLPRAFAPASMVLRVNPGSGISYDVRTDFDTKFQRFRNASISTHWQQEKLFIAGTYFRTNAIDKGTFDSHHIQGQAGYGSPLKGLSASVTLSYNIRTSNLLNSHSRINYAWDCCGIAMEFQQFDLGQRIETRFYFSFNLKGIGSFGTLKRPESLF